MDAVTMIKNTDAIRLLLAALLFFPATSYATNFNYTNFEIGFTSNPSSLSVKSRFAFSENAHFIFTGNSQFDGDWIASAGAGFQAPINAFFDIHGDGRLYSIKFPNQETHDFGDLAYGVNLGVRAWVLPQLEANLLIGQIAFDSSDTRSVVELGGRFHSTEAISIGATYRSNGIYKGQFYFSVRFEL